MIAIPAHAFALIEAIGERSEFVTIENAGHALLPEQPALLADTVIGWLSARSERRTSAN